MPIICSGSGSFHMQKLSLIGKEHLGEHALHNGLVVNGLFVMPPFVVPLHSPCMVSVNCCSHMCWLNFPGDLSDTA